MPAGRPLKFKTVEELQGKIDAYFESCYANVIVKDKDGHAIIDEDGNIIKELQQVEPIAITGLALALDTSREVLMDIQNQVSEGYSKEYSDAVIRAKLRCQNYAEKQMFTARSANGPIFALKNYGWDDTRKIDLTANVKQSGSLDNLTDEELKQLQGILAKADIE